MGGGGGFESSNHFFFQSPKYKNIRNIYLQDEVHYYSVHDFLFGVEAASDTENEALFIKVQNYIMNSKRFKDDLPYLFHSFRNKYFYQISLGSMLYIQNKFTSFEKMHGFPINMQ